MVYILTVIRLTVYPAGVNPLPVDKILSVRDRVFLLCLAAATVACYAPGLDAPAAYDDRAAVLDNPAAASLPLALGAALRDAPPHRHLTEASFALNRLLAGDSLPALRAGNLGIHLAAAALVFLLARRWGGSGPARWAAAFFALHPLGVQTVTYLCQRVTGLEALLAFLSLCLYGIRGSRRAYAGALGACLLALGAKETALTLPLLLAASAWILRDGSLRRWLPFGALAAGAVALKLAHPGEGMASPYGFSPRDYLLLQLPIVLRYLRLNFLPFPLHFLHDRIVPLSGHALELPWTAILLSGTLLAALAGWALFGPARHRLPRLGIALFLAPLALESTVPIQDLAFDHRCYPGLLGTGLLFAWAASRLGRTWPVLVLLGALTLRENAAWASPRTLLARDVRNAFHLDVAWGNYAWYRLGRGDAVQAERLFRQALHSPWKELRIRLGEAAALIALGRVPEGRARVDAAMRDFPAEGGPVRLALQEAVRSGDEARISDIVRRAEGKVKDPELEAWFRSRRRR